MSKSKSFEGALLGQVHERLCLLLRLATFLIVFQGASAVHAELNMDRNLGSVAGWDIGISKDMKGCLASARYEDGTTAWIGVFGDSNQFYIAFTNPKWQALVDNQGYELGFITSRRRWKGKAWGFSRGGEKGLHSDNLRLEFVSDIADSGGVHIQINGARVGSLSLKGSHDAIDAVVYCQKKISEIAGSTDQEQQQAEEGIFTGTGFFISPEGHLITNFHVVDGCTSIEAVAVGEPVSKAQLVARDKTNDLALLRTQPNGTIVVPALKTQVRLGEPIFVFGFPLTGLLSGSGNFTSGSIAAVTGMRDDTRFVQISAPVQPGNSGGPLIDKSGNIVGVVVAKLDAIGVAEATKDIPQNVNFAIKASILLNFLESNGIAANTSRLLEEMKPEYIAEMAKKFTVQVVCKKEKK